MNESNILGISVRALIAFTLVVGVVVMQGFGHDVKEPMYTLVVMAVSFYLGKSTPPAPPGGPDTTSVTTSTTVTNPQDKT